MKREYECAVFQTTRRPGCGCDEVILGASTMTETVDVKILGDGIAKEFESVEPKGWDRRVFKVTIELVAKPTEGIEPCESKESS